MKSRSPEDSNDERFLSQSFGGASSMLLSKPRVDFARNHLSEITCSGYLLKRSNEPLQHPSVQKYFHAHDSLTVPDLPHMPESSQGDNSQIKQIKLGDTTLGEPSYEQFAPKTPAEVGIQSIAAFFGLPLQANAEHLSGGQTGEPVSLEPSAVERRAPITASTPIKVRRPLHENPIVETHLENTSNLRGFESNNSAGEQTDLMKDVVDLDGHIWRSKFCVLEEGILYFYRNAQDANTIIAVEERQSVQVQRDQNGTKCHSPKDLSKSPVSRGIHGQSGSSSKEESNNCIWEKRVFLSSVGSVRSAEQEFGANAFQLEAISEGQRAEKTDTLVLRARNESDMKEWIFQFHRSLSWFMRSFMKSEIYMDIAYPATASHADYLLQFHRSDKKIQSFFPPSAMSTENVDAKGSLSHGHGRISLHRTRQLTTKSLSLDNEAIATSDVNASISPGINATIGPKSFSLDANRSPETGPISNDGRDQRNKKNLSSARAYIPPHLRRKMEAGQFMSGHSRPASNGEGSIVSDSKALTESEDSTRTPSLGYEVATASLNNGSSASNTSGSAIYQKGGCAGQIGSILDSRYVPRKASKLGANSSSPFGCFGGNRVVREHGNKAPIRWEVGAVSECGIRDSNEDAYLISNDLLHQQNYMEMSEEIFSVKDRRPGGGDDKVGLFAIFDGHQGDQAARFAAEKLGEFILDEIDILDKINHELSSSFPSLNSPRMELSVRNAIARLDREFCCLCHDGGRKWESGATALVALLVDNSLVVANLGDCRGVICRGVVDTEPYVADDAWHDVDDPKENTGLQDSLQLDSTNYFWRGMTRVHSPSVKTERQRIEEANGWVTTETEIPIGQLRRIDFRDEDVVKILKRGFSEDEEENVSGIGKQSKAAPQRILEIFRVCGDLSVSRAIGDRDFKAEYNAPCSTSSNEDPSSQRWEGPLYLQYPDKHDGHFRGDLVSCVPDFQSIEVGEKGVYDEFLLLACDGLWDVLDADDAIRVTRELLVHKKCEAKQAAARLAELAIHLGSSDNVTVIIVRLM